MEKYGASLEQLLAKAAATPPPSSIAAEVSRTWKPRPAAPAQPLKSRAHHLADAKETALEYLETGNVTLAIASMDWELSQHEELRTHPRLMAFIGSSSKHHQVREWIDSFN